MVQIKLTVDGEEYWLSLMNILKIPSNRRLQRDNERKKNVQCKCGQEMYLATWPHGVEASHMSPPADGWTPLDKLQTYVAHYELHLFVGYFELLYDNPT